jgi:hypothetical protein
MFFAMAITLVLGSILPKSETFSALFGVVNALTTSPVVRMVQAFAAGGTL